ncbi:hypothetical protein BY458DRAFT_524511 [Sporodiniella umbellata]|nr:hypothetical protein BY458DRAFT_524511 [Sporodiniella umbellata]
MCRTKGVPVLTRLVTNHRITRSNRATPKECIICLDTAYTFIYPMQECSHLVCETCLVQYLEDLVGGNPQQQYETLACPQTDCRNRLDTSQVLNTVMASEQIMQWWEKASMIQFIKNKVTCPFTTCGVSYDIGEEFLKECSFTSCLLCHRGFCTACQKPWHPGEMKVINETEEDKKLLETAKKKAWTRCPKCQRFVEKISGCTSMVCACGTCFCYRCGGLQSDHSCNNSCEKKSPQELQEVREAMFSSRKPSKTQPSKDKSNK